MPTVTNATIPSDPLPTIFFEWKNPPEAQAGSEKYIELV